VHHAIRTVKFQLQDSSVTKGRWVIEGDLASYFDTVHHIGIFQESCRLKLKVMPPCLFQFQLVSFPG